MLIEPIKPASATTFQDVLVVVMRTAQDERVIAATDDLCAAMGGRATALLVSPFQGSVMVGDAYDGGAEVWAAILAELRKSAAQEGERLRQRLAKARSRIEFRTVETDPLMSRQLMLMSARHADITVFASAPKGEDHTARIDLLQAALFESGRPILVVPPDYKKPVQFKNVLIAWNASREAARAVGDAATILSDADRVTVLTVDAHPRMMGLGEAPGADIGAHLAHRGVNAEVRNVSSGDCSDAEAILRAAHDIDADLIVLGGYGHARLREFVFGGVTRELLSGADIPLFMSH